MNGFKNHLKSYRSNRSNLIDYTSRIRVPFQLQTHMFSDYNLEWSDITARIICVDLHRMKENYGVAEDIDSFETCCINN